jgi:16S rRNA (cytidine1402-2'-O)-methyltransferase
MGDLSPRAKEAIQQCDLLLCEDTRHTGQLLHLAGISARQLWSFHKFNEAEKEEHVLQELRAGKVVGLVSDAGTPGIADPGARLVNRCHEEGIQVSTIPGPCAFVAAYALSGYMEEAFQFFGFLPKTKAERRKIFDKMREYPGASIVYESPYRIKETLSELDPEWNVVMVRELTKIHEQVVRAQASELLDQLKDKEVKGECVLIILPSKKEKPSSDVLIQEVHHIRESFSCSVKEAIEAVAKAQGVSQKELYRLILRA